MLSIDTVPVLWYSVNMDKESCLIYEGAFHRVEWYFEMSKKTESTFDKFITNNPEQKEKFDKEYDEFLLSEFIIQSMEEENISIRGLAEKANVSPTIIQKLRNNDTAEKINYSTFLAVIRSLGYRLRLERV